MPLMGGLFLIPMEFYALFVHVSRSTFELIMVKSGAIIFLLIVIPALYADMLLLKEICLYNDGVENMEIGRWKGTAIGPSRVKMPKHVGYWEKGVF